MFNLTVKHTDYEIMFSEAIQWILNIYQIKRWVESLLKIYFKTSKNLLKCLYNRYIIELYLMENNENLIIMH